MVGGIGVVVGGGGEIGHVVDVCFGVDVFVHVLVVVVVGVRVGVGVGVFADGRVGAVNREWSVVVGDAHCGGWEGGLAQVIGGGRSARGVVSRKGWNAVGMEDWAVPREGSEDSRDWRMFAGRCSLHICVKPRTASTQTASAMCGVRAVAAVMMAMML